MGLKGSVIAFGVVLGVVAGLVGSSQGGGEGGGEGGTVPPPTLFLEVDHYEVYVDYIEEGDQLRYALPQEFASFQAAELVQKDILDHGLRVEFGEAPFLSSKGIIPLQVSVVWVPVGGWPAGEGRPRMRLPGARVVAGRQ